MISSAVLSQKKMGSIDDLLHSLLIRPESKRLGSAGEKGKGRRDGREEKITRRGQRGCWVIKEIKKREKGRGLLLCISLRTKAGTRALVARSPHSYHSCPSGKRVHHFGKIPFSSTSEMTVVITPLSRHSIITLHNQSPKISLCWNKSPLFRSKGLHRSGGKGITLKEQIKQCDRTQ